jgi:hypothetical protein
MNDSCVRMVFIRVLLRGAYVLLMCFSVEYGPYYSTASAFMCVCARARSRVAPSLPSTHLTPHTSPLVLPPDLAFSLSLAVSLW